MTTATQNASETLTAIAGRLYANPRLADAETVRAVASILRAPNQPEPVYRMAAEVQRFLLTSGAGRETAADLIALAAETNLTQAVYAAAVQSLRYAAAWTPGWLDAEALLSLLSLEHLGAWRQILAEKVIEPCLYHAGAGLTAATFDRFTELCSEEPFFKYFCFYVAARPDFRAEIREKAMARASAGLPFHGQVREMLGRGHQRALVIQNIKDGQGDEIVRTVPLMQALLDFNPQFEITLLTGRPYLYAHPRLEIISIRDRGRITDLLGGPFDVVIDFCECQAHPLNYDWELEPMVQTCIGKSRPALVLSARKGYNDYVFHRCDLNSRPLAKELGLDRWRVENTYETTFRLIAELGLPLRCGEGRPVSEPVLASPQESAGAWAALTTGNAERRPVALLNPFGGNEALKGYGARKMGALALEIQRLIREGFYVVLLPNGTPWSKPHLLQQAVSHLEPGEQVHVMIGPDPAGQSGAHADHTMRLFFGFIGLADLTVTVEGWAVHVAYCLGRPYRVLMLPYSHPAEWRGYAATCNQRVVEDILDLDEEEDAPPLPAQPRKFTLLFLLREQATPLLRRALRSEDHDVRRAAALSLRDGIAETPASDFLGLLDDPSYHVRAIAAAALLLRPPVSLPRDQLEAYVKIGEEPRDWVAVFKLGDAARPALEAGLDDDDHVLRRETVQILRMLDLKANSRARRNGIVAGLSKLLRPARHAEKHLETEKEKPAGPTILVLTPVKDGAGCIGRYCRVLSRLTFPHRSISLGFLEGDSSDSSLAELERSLPALREQFRRVGLWKKDFGFRVPDGVHRAAEHFKDERRTILARARNHLLLHALDDEDWVLWLDVDVIEYPRDIVERLLATGKEIVQPHCVLDYGGPTFDRNAWRDRGSLHLEDLRSAGELVELHAVGGTMLLVRADLHRDGLVFPAFPYGVPNAQVRADRGERGEVETEGLGLMARDMGHRCWGMPNLEIRHRRW